MVKPALLSGSHHGAAGIVADGVDVVSVPIQVSNGAVVLSGVQHDEVE